MQIENITGIGLATGRAFEHQRDLSVSHCVLREIVINDQGVHPIVHEPFTHGAPGKRYQILVGRRVGSCSADDNGVGEGTFPFEGVDDLSNVGLLLAHSHVNTIKGTIVLITRLFSCLVLTCLGDDGVNTDRGLTCGTVTDDELTLTASNRNHRINCHDTGLHRLAYRLSGYNTRSDLFDGIMRFCLNGTFTIQGLAQSVDHAAQHCFADGNLKQFTRGLDFGAFFDVGVLTEDDGSDLGFLEVECQTGCSIAEIQHLIEHAIGQAFDFGHTVTDFSDNANVFLGDTLFGSRYLGFDFFN